MKLKKTICLVTSIALLAAFLIGCSVKDAQESSAARTTVSTAAETEPVDPNILTKEPVKLIYVRPIWGANKIDSEPVERVRKLIREKTNVDIQLVGEIGSTSSVQKINLMVAAGEPFDMIYDSFIDLASKAAEIPRLVKEGIIIPLDELMQNNAPQYMELSNPEIRKYGMYNGKQYAIPGESVGNVHSLAYRKDWLDAEGLKVPTTLDEWEAVAKVFKEKYKDVGFEQVWDGAMEYVFVGSFVPSAYGNYLDADGKLKPYYTHPNFKDYLAKMQDWYKKGYIHKEIATLQNAWGDITTGKTGLFHSWADTSAIEAALKVAVPEGTLVWGPPLKGVTSEGTIYMNDPIQEFVAITESCKTPDVAMKYINWTLATKEGYELTAFGQPGQDWNVIKTEGDNVFYNLNESVPAEQRCSTVIFNTVWLQTLRYKYIQGEVKTSWFDEVSSFKMGERKDLGLIYDTSIMKSKDKSADLEVMLKEAKYKIIMGVDAVDTWDKVMQSWYEKGGNQIIDDLNEQYNSWKAAQK